MKYKAICSGIMLSIMIISGNYARENPNADDLTGLYVG